MDKKYSNKTIKNYERYAKWYDKMEKKGFVMDERATLIRNSLNEFDLKMKDLNKEYHEFRKFDNTPLEELKARSFSGGSRKQVNAYYKTLKEGMDALKEKDEALYNKYNQKIKDKTGFDFEELGEKDLAYMEMRGAGLVNKNRWFVKNEEQGGIFDLLYMDLMNEAGIEMTWNSPD